MRVRRRLAWRGAVRRGLRGAAGGTRPGLMLGRSAGYGRLRCGARAWVARSNSLRSTSFRFVQTGARESVVEARKRADPCAALLAAPEIAPAGYRLPRRHRLGFATKSKSPPSQRHRIALSPNTTDVSAKARSGRSERASEAEPGHRQSSGLAVPGEEPGHWPGAACTGLRSAGLVARARSALRRLTCRRLFERSAAKQAE